MNFSVRNIFSSNTGATSSVPAEAPNDGFTQPGESIEMTRRSSVAAPAPRQEGPSLASRALDTAGIVLNVARSVAGYPMANGPAIGTTITSVASATCGAMTGLAVVEGMKNGLSGEMLGAVGASAVAGVVTILLAEQAVEANYRKAPLYAGLAGTYVAAATGTVMVAARGQGIELPRSALIPLGVATGLGGLAAGAGTAYAGLRNVPRAGRSIAAR